MNWYSKSQFGKEAEHLSGRYYYRVHPKAKIHEVLTGGLWSYSPGDHPGAYSDRPEMERWPDQEPEDAQSYRFYVAKNEWETSGDRFRIRIPAEYIEDRLVKDHLGDYYIDTGSDSEQILEPWQYDVDIGAGQWRRADMVGSKTMGSKWREMYAKPPGFYNNLYEDKGTYDALENDDENVEFEEKQS